MGLLHPDYVGVRNDGSAANSIERGNMSRSIVIFILAFSLFVGDSSLTLAKTDSSLAPYIISKALSEEASSDFSAVTAVRDRAGEESVAREIGAFFAIAGDFARKNGLGADDDILWKAYELTLLTALRNSKNELQIHALNEKLEIAWAIRQRRVAARSPRLPASGNAETAFTKARVIFEEESKKAKSDAKTLNTALDNLKQWLNEDRFREYHDALIGLIDLAETDKGAAKELYDSFWRTMPFGTGGRRWKIGIGPNRMNAYMAAITAQGHVKYLKDVYPEQVKRKDAVVGVWDVRAFHKFFAESPSLQKYREIIEARCPALAGLSSEGLSKAVALVYAGNGITYIHSNQMRATPWLSFVVNRFGGIVKNAPFSGETGKVLNGIKNVMAGIVLSSSHNPYDNNGTKFYEASGAQAPPQIVQKLMDLGNEVSQIQYYGGEAIYNEGRDIVFEKAVKDGRVIVLEGGEGGNLAFLDEAYVTNVIEEIKSFYSDKEWAEIQPNFERLIASFSALNGTGETNVLPILERLKIKVARSQGDTPTWEFTEGYGNIPNPEAEKAFNTAMQIGVRRTLDWLFETNPAVIKAVIDEDGIEIPMAVLEIEHKKLFVSADELFDHVRKTRGKFIRGLALEVTDETAETVRAFSILNNICLLTDPDADRVGLGIEKIERKGELMRLRWLSANDNDESGIILFRYTLERLRAMAERGDLIQHIETRRLEDKKGVSKSGRYQLVMVNTVVSNPLERVIAERLSEDISRLTGKRVSVKMITQHVGFKFTGEIIDNINKGEFNGITGELLRQAGIDMDEAFYVMSSEEGEGSLIGYRGSIDKDSGVTSAALAVLAAEQLAKDKTMHDYLMETYALYGYSKSYLEPMVMTGDYGFRMINDNIMGYLRDQVMPAIRRGEAVRWGEFILTGGQDHYDLMKGAYGQKPEEWPQAVRESVNIIEFDARLPDGTRIRIVLRPSGTEPKHKNVVFVVGTPLKEGEDLNDYINKINALNREVMDEVMTACYKASDAEYKSAISEQAGDYRISALNQQDLKELLRIFPIVVSCETKLAIYFPLRDYLIKKAKEMAFSGTQADVRQPLPSLRATEGSEAISEEIASSVASLLPRNDDYQAASKAAYNAEYAKVREKVTAYLVNFKKEDGIQFVEESVLLNLKHQMESLPPAPSLGSPEVRAIYIQAILWFGADLGHRHFVNLLNSTKGADKTSIESALAPIRVTEAPPKGSAAPRGASSGAPALTPKKLYAALSLMRADGEVVLPEADLENLSEAERSSVSFIAVLKGMAARAGKGHKKLIVGFDTSWIPGYEMGQRQYKGLNPLISAVDNLDGILKKAFGLDNIVVIRDTGDSLANRVYQAAKVQGFEYTYVLAGIENTRSGAFNSLKASGVKLAAVNPEKLIEGYENSRGQEMLIRIIDMINLVVLYSPDKPLPKYLTSNIDITLENGIIIFTLRAEPMDTERLERYYRLQRQTILLAA